MKKIVFILMFCLWCSQTFSQEIISVQFKNITIKEALQNIEKQYSKTTFSYNNKLKELHQTINKSYNNRKVEDVIKDLLSTTGLKYKINGDNIIIYKSRASKGQQKSHTLSGYVYDKKTGQALIGCNIFSSDNFKGTVTNTYGFYSLTLDADETITVIVSYLGYNDEQLILTLNGDVRQDIYLFEANNSLDEVVISATRKLNKVYSGAVSLSPKGIEKLPLPMGEPDVIKAIQLQNGIKTLSDGASFFYVRGGNHDQNLVVVDEATLYNASHVLGLVSVINNEVIKKANFYKGYIPPNFSGGASSVLDITTKEGNLNNFSLSGGISSMGIRAVAQGPLIKDKLSYMVSGRKSWLGLVTKDAPEYYDFNTKFHWKVNDNNKLYLSFYNGHDNISSDGIGSEWSNTLASLRWNHIYSGKLFSNTSLVYNSFKGTNISDGLNREWENQIKELKLKYGLLFCINDKHKLSSSLKVTKHDFLPGKLKDNSLNLGTRKNVSYSTSLTYNVKLTPKLTVDYGFNFTSYNALGSTKLIKLDDDYNVLKSFQSKSGTYKSWTSLEPRANIMYAHNKHHRSFASFSRVQQFAHSLDNYENDYDITKLWVPVSNNIEPIKANIFSAGHTYSNDKLDLNVEGFYKTIENQLDYVNYPDFYSENFESFLRVGNAKAYGVELGVSYQFEKLNLHLDYSYSKARLKVSGINDGKSYVAPYDIPHQLSINGVYKFNSRWELAGLWKFSSGRPFTLPVGQQLIGNGNNFEEVPLFGNRNNARASVNHRLDLTVRLLPRPDSNKPWKGTWIFGIYNAYGKKNPLAFSYDFSADKVSASGTSVTGFLPFVAYSFKF